MIRKIIYLIIVMCLLACQQSPENLVTSLEKDSSIKKLAKGQVPVDFVISESGYTAEVIAANLTAPEGTAMHGNGVLFVLQSTKANILKITPSGNATEIAQIPFEEPPAPALIDLLIDPPRGMFVTLLRHGKIFNISFSGTVNEFASNLSYPLFMAIDHEKNIYVSELYGYSITRFDHPGNSTNIVELDSDTRPRGIEFDEQERLFVLSRNGEIRRFDINSAPSFPMPLSSGILIAAITTADQVQDMTFGFDGDLFVVGINDVYRVKLNGEFTTFATGLQGPYNVINTNIKGDLLVSDYAQNEEGAGRVIKINRGKKK